MSVSLHITQLNKNFGKHRILNAVNLELPASSRTAILGANGSGKSTLLKIISGFMHYDKGNLQWKNAVTGDIVPAPDFSYSAPYLDLFDYLSLDEHIDFHFKQKRYAENLGKEDIITYGQFEEHRHKQIRQLSSGIRQRFKNALAVFSDSKVLFLDEPCSNLDEQNVEIYQSMVLQFAKDRTVIIASNHPPEYEFFCTEQYRIDKGVIARTGV